MIQISDVWRNRNFCRLWIGETLAQTGSQISALAFPLTAAVFLHCGPGVVALLATAQHLPIVLMSLFAGHWVDRYSIRTMVLVCHLPRAALIGCVPLAYAAGVLDIRLLLADAFAVGCFSAIFDIAFVTYIPRLVGRGGVQEANAKVEWTYSIAEGAGPGIGGMIVHFFGAPVAPLGNAASYLAACALGWGITTPRNDAATAAAGPRMGEMIRETLLGFRMIWRHPILRPLVVQASLFNLLGFVTYTLFVVFGAVTLGLPAMALGWILASANVGAFLSAGWAGPLGRRFGIGRTLVWAIVVETVALGLIPAAAGPTPVVVGMLAAGFVIHGLGAGVCNVHLLNIRAECVPNEYLGRVIGGWRLVCWGAIPLNGLLASALAVLIGTRSAIAVTVGLLSVACLKLFPSRLMTYTGGGPHLDVAMRRTRPVRPGNGSADD